jgi:RNA polymerase sigma-70 factor (ECF subfamily)
MGAAERAEIEDAVRRACQSGDYDAAATSTIRGYGPEVLGFLRAFHRNDQDAADVFSVFAEDLWKGLATFAWECSLRTWAYTVARRASHRTMRPARRAAARNTSESVLSQVVAKVRTETLTYLRTEKKTKIRALRETLPEADQMLLVLRVDRGLSWDEVARVLSDRDLGEVAVEREVARLRKRFQLVKERLVTLAKKEGLYPSRDGDE